MRLNVYNRTVVSSVPTLIWVLLINILKFIYKFLINTNYEITFQNGDELPYHIKHTIYQNGR